MDDSSVVASVKVAAASSTVTTAAVAAAVATTVAATAVATISAAVISAAALGASLPPADKKKSDISQLIADKKKSASSAVSAFSKAPQTSKATPTYKAPPTSKLGADRPTTSKVPNTKLQVSVAADAISCALPTVCLKLDGKGKGSVSVPLPPPTESPMGGEPSVASYSRTARRVSGSLNFGDGRTLRFKVGDVASDTERERGVSLAGYVQCRDGLRRQKLLLVLTPELAVEVSVLGNPHPYPSSNPNPNPNPNSTMTLTLTQP